VRAATCGLLGTCSGRPFPCDKDGGVVDDDDNRLWVQQYAMQKDTTEQGSPMFVKSDCG